MVPTECITADSGDVVIYRTFTGYTAKAGLVVMIRRMSSDTVTSLYVPSAARKAAPQRKWRAAPPPLNVDVIRSPREGVRHGFQQMARIPCYRRARTR